MALGDSARLLVRHTTTKLSRGRRRYIAPHWRDHMTQLLVAGGVGVVLGAFVLLTLSLESFLAPLILLSAAVPFVALVVDVRKLFLALIILDIPFPVDIRFNYQERIGELDGIGGITFSVTTISLVVLYGVWIVQLLTRRTMLNYKVLRATLLPFIYLGAAVLSTGAAYNATVSLNELVLLIQLFLVYFYVVNTIDTRDDVMFIATMLLVGVVLESLVMIGLLFIGGPVDIGGLLVARIDDHGRVGGTVASPNGTGDYLALQLSLTIGMLWARGGRTQRWLSFAAFGLGSIALVLTQSRGSWLAYGLILGLFFLMVWWRGWLSTKAVFAIVVVGLLLMPFVSDIVVARLTEDDGGAAESRLPLMELSFRMIVNNPVFGVGVNNFVLTIDEYATAKLSGEWLRVVHNKFLLIWSETGLIGLLAFVLFLLNAVRYGWQAWLHGDRQIAPLALGCAIGVIGQMTQMLVHIFNGRPQLQGLWLITGLLAAMSYFLVQKVPEPETRHADESLPRLTPLLGGRFE